MKYVGYIRVSTGDQAESGLGLDRQREKIEGYCELHEHELVQIEADEGESGRKEDRKGLQRALDVITAGEADGILVAKLDRLTRSSMQLEELIEQSRDENWALTAIEEAFDTSTASGRMFARMLGAINEWKCDVISARTKAALRKKKERGEYTGGRPPFGYTPEDGELIEDPEEQEIIDYILHCRWKMNMSYDDVVLSVEEKYDRSIGKSTVHRVIDRAEEAR